MVLRVPHKQIDYDPCYLVTLENDVSRNWGNETPERELRRLELSNCARLV